MQIEMIVATDKNDAIGKAGKLAWHIPEDLAFFKSKTINNAVFMGRKTFESIGKALPYRENFVLSHNVKNNSINDVIFVSDFEDVLKVCKKDKIFIIGGGQIYKAFLSKASVIWKTEVETEIENPDTFFPSLNQDNWKCKVIKEIPSTKNSPRAVIYKFTRKLE